MTKIKIEFTSDQLNVLNSAVCELPFRIASPLINHINAEIQKAFNAQADLRDMPTGQTPPKDALSGD